INCKRDSYVKEMLTPFIKQVCNQAVVNRVDIETGASKPEKCAASGHASFEIYIPLEEIVDIESEKKKLASDIEKLNGQISKIEKRLNSKQFLNKAPKEVIERERERIAMMIDRGKRMKSILEDLK
ncbi:hypothetical protein J7M07_00385, partial [bacterium]|nr:hypothetical protein [bacterium]